MGIVRLPPFEVKSVVKALSETLDWGLSSNNIPKHWTKTKGKGIKVAVLDTGIDTNHQDLIANIKSARDFTGSAFGPEDRLGHGTHTAGTIGAAANGIGMIGVAPECEIHSIKVLGDDGSGRNKWVANGFAAAREMKADVASFSAGSPQDDPLIRTEIEKYISNGGIVICAAGNDGRDNTVNYPAQYTIAVAAYDKLFRLAPFSSRGPQVTLAAPGVDIISTYPGFLGNYAELDGTSMATPFVTGVIALALSLHRLTPNLVTPITNQKEAKEHLQRTAKDAGAQGFDQGFGWGLINADSLLAEKPQTPEPPSNSPPIILGPFQLPQGVKACRLIFDM